MEWGKQKRDRERERKIEEGEERDTVFSFIFIL
jgi:hypothetical protein